MKRRIAIGSATAAVLAALAPSWASAAPPITDYLNQSGGQCPPYGAVRICSGDVPSFDGVTLDMDLTVPMHDDGSRHPLIVMLNGFGADKRYWESNTDEGDGGDLYHWNNHWFARHGYYVLTYTPRGFATDPPEGNRPGTPRDSSSALDETNPSPSDLTNATIRLKSREFEIRDTQWLAALVADSFNVDPEQIAVTGNSYGGGESWLQASQATWTFPNVRDPELPLLELQAAIPKYGWSDLAYSLGPNGHPTRGSIYESSQGNADSPTGEGNPIGVPKESYITAFYGIGSNLLPGESGNIFEKGTSDCAATEEGCYNVDAWKARIDAGEPYEATPAEIPLFDGLVDVEDPLIKQIRRGLTEFRGSYYQDWKEQCGYDPATESCDPGRRKVAIFAIQGWTDDLFTAVEAFRQYEYLKRLDPRWPVSLALADVGHPRAQNKPGTWRRLNHQAWQFLSAHIRGSHEQETTVYSEPTICANDGEPDLNLDASYRLTARTPEGLSNGVLRVNYARGDTLFWTSGLDDPNGPATDPVTGFVGDILTGSQAACRASPAPPPEDSYTAQSPPLPEASTYVGLGSVRVPYEFVGLSGQLDARVWDVPPSGEEPILMTRGTYRLRNPVELSADTVSALVSCATDPDGPTPECGLDALREEGAIERGELELPLFGNHWQLKPGHRIRIDLTQVDTPFLRPSNLPSSVTFQPPTLELPTRESGVRTLSQPAG